MIRYWITHSSHSLCFALTEVTTIEGLTPKYKAIFSWSVITILLGWLKHFFLNWRYVFCYFGGTWVVLEFQCTWVWQLLPAVRTCVPCEPAATPGGRIASKRGHMSQEVLSVWQTHWSSLCFGDSVPYTLWIYCNSNLSFCRVECQIPNRW